MRLTVMALLVCLGAGAAQAQTVWKDPTGRISFDLDGTSWSLHPRDGAPNNVILNIVPEDVLKGGPVTRICALDYKTQPHDQSRTQEAANDALKSLHRMDDIMAYSPERRNAGVVVVHDGVAMQHIEQPMKHAQSGEDGLTIGRSFILPGDHLMQYVGLHCTAYASGGPNAVTEIRDIMERMHIAPMN